MPERQTKNPSHFNSFEVFEDIYAAKSSDSLTKLDMPPGPSRASSFFYWFALVLFIIVFGLSIHPLLSYALKTPYPLVVIGQDSMQPSYKKSGLVVVSGLVDRQSIEPSDVIVYKSAQADSLSIERVVETGQNQIIVKADVADSPALVIYPSQVIGKVITSKSIYLPLLDKISSFLASR